MIGVTLTPPSVAQALEFFKLSAPQTFDVFLRKGFEIATAGSGEEQAVFTTDDDLIIHAAQIYRCFALHQSVYTDFSADANNLTTTFQPFPDPLEAGDTLYIAFREDNYFEKLFINIHTPLTGSVDGI